MQALEAEARKAKAFQDKLEKDRIMMHTPLPKKPVSWRKYCATMYLPRQLIQTVVYKDRGRPGDDWRKFVKKYTIEEMNHRMAVQLHGKVPSFLFLPIVSLETLYWKFYFSLSTYLRHDREALVHRQLKFSYPSINAHLKIAATFNRNI